MTKEYFSESEAKKLVGCLVRARAGLESIPCGTGGIVTRVVKAGANQWAVRVGWQLSRKSSDYFAMLGEYSFNFRWPSKIVTHDFCKDSLEGLATVAHAPAC